VHTLRPLLAWFVALCAVACPAWGQAVISDEVRTGHHLASMLCHECHIAARDQAYPPTRDPPAASFASIAQRKDVSAESLEHFFKTTHEGIDNPKGMENPGLADFQVKAIVVYILSLRK
jgi:mono/diheme cytochrome c family protein